MTIQRVQTLSSYGPRIGIDDVTGAVYIADADGTWVLSTGGSGMTALAITGAVDGSNVTFTVAALGTKQLLLVQDGQILKLTTDYTLAATAITMVTAPQVGSNLQAFAY